MSAAGPTSGGADRGQTLPDFAVGIALFLAVIAFITLFVPQITQPFDEQEQPVVAERIGSDLTDRRLTSGESLRLNETATTAFFEKSESEVLDDIGINSPYSLNVTIRNASSQESNSRILCAVDGESEWIGENCADESDQFAIGEPIPQDDRAVATTRRTAFVGDRDVVIEVGVW